MHSSWDLPSALFRKISMHVCTWSHACTSGSVVRNALKSCSTLSSRLNCTAKSVLPSLPLSPLFSPCAHPSISWAESLVRNVLYQVLSVRGRAETRYKGTDMTRIATQARSGIRYGTIEPTATHTHAQHCTAAAAANLPTYLPTCHDMTSSLPCRACMAPLHKYGMGDTNALLVAADI